jgi:riboflavin kinase/FMN adenylyltransferase
MNAELKGELLERAGVDVVIVQRFTPEFSRIEPELFLSHIRRSLVRLTTVYVGENWRFGRGRRGDISLLIVEARKLGLSVVSAPRINLDGEPISSTRIRSCLEAGEIDKANSLLGYTYFAEGVVTPGKGLGRKLQFPTLNLTWQPELCPRFGVYVVKVSGQGASSQHAAYPAVANFGLRPTVENSTEPRLEAHLLGESCPFQAGDSIRVEWLAFLRPEEKFSGLGALTAQIGRDRETAERFFWNSAEKTEQDSRV